MITNPTPKILHSYQFFYFLISQLLDHLEPEMTKGGNLVEYHCCELFPERWFQAVYVVECGNTILFDRLTERGYNQAKISQNIQCEIFQECLRDANESYAEDIVHTLRGETEQDFQNSIEVVTSFVAKYEWDVHTDMDRQ